MQSIFLLLPQKKKKSMTSCAIVERIFSSQVLVTNLPTIFSHLAQICLIVPF